MTGITFLVEEATRDVAKAAGINTTAVREIPACPLNIGDKVTFPESPHIGFAVTGRWLRAAAPGKPAHWYVTIAQWGHPTAE